MIISCARRIKRNRALKHRGFTGTYVWASKRGGASYRDSVCHNDIIVVEKIVIVATADDTGRSGTVYGCLSSAHYSQLRGSDVAAGDWKALDVIVVQDELIWAATCVLNELKFVYWRTFCYGCRRDSRRPANLRVLALQWKRQACNLSPSDPLVTINEPTVFLIASYTIVVHVVHL